MAARRRTWFFSRTATRGRLLVDQFMLTTHWGELDVEREKSKRPAGLPPVPDDANRDLELNRQWVEWMRQNLSKQKYKVERIRPDRSDGPNAPRDEFELQVRDKFLKGPPDPKTNPDLVEFDERSLPEAEEYQYFEPIRAQESCLSTCHAPPLGGSGIDLSGSGVAMAGGPSSTSVPHLSVGDVMVIAKVTIPNGPTQRKMDWNWSVLWATAILAVFLAMVTSYAIVRYVVVKPLRHLRDVSDAVSRGNISLRAEIHTGDEFEELAGAFNRMLRGLIAVQEELRQANVNLDSKVDELAQANMRLYEMNMIKSDFLATMSHELRTPLNSILGFSDVLGSIDSLDDKQKRYVQNIQKSGRTLLDMINDILDLAKMESGKMDIRLVDFRINQVVGAQCDMARPLTEKKNIDLDTIEVPNPRCRRCSRIRPGCSRSSTTFFLTRSSSRRKGGRDHRSPSDRDRAGRAW